MENTVSYPKVLLVGRTNVGKSTLFNRLAQEKKSIVFEREGVTRDYIQELITWNDKTFDLIDTGGLVFKKSADQIQQKVQEKVLLLLEQAAIILFVCDAKNGLTQEDKIIARALHKTKKPVTVLLNKADNQVLFDENFSDFQSLGFQEMIATSGIHGIGIGTVLNLIVDRIPEPTEGAPETPRYNIVIIGKPNTGKSSLMNLLINHERSIVSDIAGTTRESIKENIYFCSDLIQVVDTAGVRKKSSVNDDLEILMVKSSMESIRMADIVLVMIDASQGKISDQELKLLFYAYEQKKIVIVLFNKTDLLTDYSRLMLDQSIQEYEFVLRKLPQLWISCLTKKNIEKILGEIRRVWNRCQQEINSTEVNEVVQEALLTKPLYHSGFQLKLFKIRTIKGPVPTFVLHVNHPSWWGDSQLGCIENILRKTYDFRGCPIQFSIRKV
jgi:GTP-binding protein